MFGVKNKHDSFRRDFEKSIEIESLQIERPFQSTSTRYRHYHDSVICGCLGVGLVATLAESQPSNNQADWCMPSEILTTTIFSYGEPSSDRQCVCYSTRMTKGALQTSCTAFRCVVKEAPCIGDF